MMMDPPVNRTAGGGGEDPELPDASIPDMEVDAPAGGGAHVEEEPAARRAGRFGGRPADCGDPSHDDG